jgi:hypothetical protein
MLATILCPSICPIHSAEKTVLIRPHLPVHDQTAIFKGFAKISI